MPFLPAKGLNQRVDASGTTANVNIQANNNQSNNAVRFLNESTDVVFVALGDTSSVTASVADTPVSIYKPLILSKEPNQTYVAYYAPSGTPKLNIQPGNMRG